jgi:hypothetical protein
LARKQDIKQLAQRCRSVPARSEHTARINRRNTMETSDQRAARLDAERAEGQLTDLEAARAFAAAPQERRAPVDEFTGPRKFRTPASMQVFTNAPFTPTPSLDPGIIKAIEGYEEFAGYLAPAENAFSSAHVALAKIAEARAIVAKDTSKTPELKLLTVAASAEKKLEQLTRLFDTARGNLTAVNRHGSR